MNSGLFEVRPFRVRYVRGRAPDLFVPRAEPPRPARQSISEHDYAVTVALVLHEVHFQALRRLSQVRNPVLTKEACHTLDEFFCKFVPWMRDHIELVRDPDCWVVHNAMARLRDVQEQFAQLRLFYGAHHPEEFTLTFLPKMVPVDWSAWPNIKSP
jgi:hypothetical protein